MQITLSTSTSLPTIVSDDKELLELSDKMLRVFQHRVSKIKKMPFSNTEALRAAIDTLKVQLVGDITSFDRIVTVIYKDLSRANKAN